MKEIAVRYLAADPKQGMTLDEMAKLCQEAMRQGIPGDAVVRIETTWRSSIKRAAVTGITEETR